MSVPAAGAHPVVEPFPADGVDAAVTGTVAWAVAGIGCLLARHWLAQADRGWWLWTCVAGVLIGMVAIAFTRRRAMVYRAHRARSSGPQPGRNRG